MAYESKNPTIREHQLKVQKLTIPFSITGGNGTPANVAFAPDMSSVLYVKTAAVDTVAGMLDSKDSITYAVAAADATGIVNFALNIKEPVYKVLATRCRSVGTASGSSIDQKAMLGNIAAAVDATYYASVAGVCRRKLTGDSSVGQKIALRIEFIKTEPVYTAPNNISAPVPLDLTSTDSMNAILEVEYIVDESALMY